MIITKQVNSPMGIHGRQATRIAKLLRTHTFTINGHPVRDALDILALGIPQGVTLTINIREGGNLGRVIDKLNRLEF